MSTIIEYLDGEHLRLAELSSTDGKRLILREGAGPKHIPADRLLFSHRDAQLAGLERRLQELTAEVDVELLWAALTDDGELGAKGASELAGLYFAVADSRHASAVFRALLADRSRFRRRGTLFTPRSADEVQQVRQKHDAERRVAEELALLQGVIAKRAELTPELATRLERWLRGAGDRLLERATSGSSDARAQICWLLVDAGHLPPTTDPQLLAAKLRCEHPPAVVQHATALAAANAPDASALLGVGRAAFTIDDAETREVDDALSAHREGELVRVDIDIADAAAHVEPGDPVDVEALRRATSVYLPTAVYYMLPAPIGCELASLEAGSPRRVLRTSIWFNARGEIERRELKRLAVTVSRRLDYGTADALLANSARLADSARGEQRELDAECATELALLSEVAEARQRRRVECGALLLRRSEWKLRVDDDGAVRAVEIPAVSRSRQLVAEMMIAANEVAATLAVDEGLPLIFRAQARPTDPLPPIDPADPGALFKLRGLIRPAALSIHPKEHWGLGLDAYAQVTSPLRRYGDLVQQRQLSAHLAGETPPYGSKELLEVLATVEATEHEMKRLEQSQTLRWALEAAAQGPRRGLTARVMAQVKSGYKVQLLQNGAEGLLDHRGQLEVGQEIAVDIERVRPRRGTLRLVQAREP